MQALYYDVLLLLTEYTLFFDIADTWFLSFSCHIKFFIEPFSGIRIIVNYILLNCPQYFCCISIIFRELLWLGLLWSFSYYINDSSMSSYIRPKRACTRYKQKGAHEHNHENTSRKSQKKKNIFWLHMRVSYHILHWKVKFLSIILYICEDMSFFSELSRYHLTYYS